MPIGRAQIQFVALALLLGACQSAPVDESVAAAAEVRAADIAWAEAAAARNIDAVVAAVEPTGSMMAPNAPIATGPEAIRAAFDAFYAMPGMTLHWQPTNVEAARSGELGYSMGTYELSFTDPNGNPVTDRGKYGTVWRRQADGSWKVVLDVFNSDIPVPGS